MRTAIHTADPGLAILYAGRLDPERWLTVTAARFVTWTAAGLGVVALILAMTGLYGVLSHVIERRTREIGIRMALGADRRRVISLVLRDGCRPVVEGIVLGSVTAMIVRSLLQAQSTTPLAGFGSIAVMSAVGALLVAASLACYLPARRAAGVQPNIAIRNL